MVSGTRASRPVRVMVADGVWSVMLARRLSRNSPISLG